MKYVEDYENIPGKEWPVRPHHFPGIRTQPLVQMDEAEFGTGRSPAAYRLQRLPENIHLPTGGTYIQVFRKTMKESIPHIARHGALVAVDFIPFQLDHRNGQPHSPPASSPDRGAWDSRVAGYLC